MRKLILSTLVATGMALQGNAQSVIGTTYYYDRFNDNTVASNADEGWYNDASVYSAPTETGGKLSVTATNADQYFKGFGMYFKAATAVNLSGNKTLSVIVTNPTASAMRVRIDLKLVVPGFFASLTGVTNTTMIAAGDTIQANYKSGTSIQQDIAANATTTINFDYAGSQYEYDKDGGAWSPEYLTITDFTRFAGLYIVINGGAGETWCTTPGVCSALSGTITFDDLNIGNGPLATQGASDLIASHSIFPNPVSDMANVSLNLKSASDVKVTLSDMLGKEVMTITEGTFTEMNKSFDVSSLNKGAYTVNYFINGVSAKSELLMVK